MYIPYIAYSASRPLVFPTFAAQIDCFPTFNFTADIQTLRFYCRITAYKIMSGFSKSSCLTSSTSISNMQVTTTVQFTKV